MLVPQFAGMANFDTLIDARAAGRLGSLGEIRHLEFDAKTGAGTLALPHELPKPLEFERIEFAGDVRNAFDTVNITEAKIDFGQPQLELSVFASRLGDNLRARLDAELAVCRCPNWRNIGQKSLVHRLTLGRQPIYAAVR